MRPAAETTAIDIESLVAEVADQFTEEVKQGRSPSVEEYAQRHPEIAHIIRQVFPALAMLDEFSATAISEDATAGLSSSAQTDDHVTGVLGDFRILHELGRGGMGVVYEAEQISLGRRVVLKVLPFAAMLDKQQLARFKNEAHAAATLDHPNIVAIFSVGTERGVHYYAMQLIDGQSLAEAIAQLRNEERGARSKKPPPLPSGEGRGEGALESAIRNPQSEIPTAVAALSTVRTSPSALPTPSSSLPAFDSLEYFRAVARLGIQAAEALDHAHQNGILHRDVKPGNLLVDETGKLWVTDFGLARIEADAGLTMTGDILGTLRYMSPEQALAKRVVVDHRRDIYSLGITLYELLTLQPAYTGDDRQELLRQIAFDEPRSPRQLNARIPQDLATIILKAIEKNPADRYATARDVANDLRRYLDDQPIKAKPQSLVATTRKWSRRHRDLLIAAAAALAVCGLVLAGSVGWVVRDRAARQSLAEAAATSALDEATLFLHQEKWPYALAAVKRAEDVLASAGDGGATSSRANELRRDVEMVQRLEEIRAGPETAIGVSWSLILDPETDRENAEAFRLYGIDIESLAPTAAAKRVARSPIRLELVTALDRWASLRRTNRPDDESWKRLVEIARLADPDLWRNRLRDALGKEGKERLDALTELATSIDAESLPPQTILLLTDMLRESHAGEQAVAPLLAARRRHPDHFWINLRLGRSQVEPDDAVRYNTVAQALRPESAIAHNNLGVALWLKGESDEAIASYREAIRLKPDDALAHMNLGTAFSANGLWEEAIICHRKAIAGYRESVRQEPDLPYAYRNLANSMVRAGKLGDAIAELKFLQSKFGPSNTVTLAFIDAMVQVLSIEQKNFDLARKLGEEALLATRRDLGTKHVETLGALKSLVRVHMWSGESLSESDAEYAQKLCEEALEQARQISGPDCDDSLGTAHDLAKILQIRGKYEEAHQLYEKTLAENQRVFGDGHFRNFHVMRDSASALLDLGRIEEAAAKLEHAINGFRPLEIAGMRVYAADGGHWTLGWKLLLANAKSKLGQHDQARQTYEQVLKNARQTYSAEHAIVNQSIRALAWFLATANSDEHRDGPRAVELATQACELTKYADADALDTLAAAYAETGNFAAAVEWSTKALAPIKNDVVRKKFVEHLESFQAGKPWRE